MPQQTHYDIAELLFRKGISNVVLSPGSRSATLSLAIIRHPKLKTFTISDERSAAFIALGMAESLKKPVALLCTSGTAAINYYPAIAEAFYRGIPLIVLTSDRPPELIDQWDGQTIRQKDLYKNHIVAACELSTDIDITENRRFAFREINQIINKAIIHPGPVHINIPFREPLYPKKGELIKYSNDIPIFSPEITKLQVNSSDIKTSLNSFRRVMILVGQMPENKTLNKILFEISKDKEALIIGDHISNIHPKDHFISSQDVFLANGRNSKLPKPDLLVTLGRSILSKNLKTYLRNIKGLVHWQVGNYEPHDTYFKLQKVISIPELRFLQITQTFFESEEPFIDAWKIEDQKAQKHISKVLEEKEFSELKAVAEVLKGIKKKTDLHLANSLATRYANILQHLLPEDCQVFCNRGTSGIDGCSSTAVGHALSSDKLQILITGDLAFFYDRNAFWHNYDLSNLRIVLLNNHGGGIFRVIKGPSEQAELDEYFDTFQNLNAKNTVKDFNMEYRSVCNLEDLQNHLKSFYKKSLNPVLIEIETEKDVNSKHFKRVFDL